ncbi:hypothetical protein LINGRAHAP2_LOCUS7470 [Linum grandiflorum]
MVASAAPPQNQPSFRNLRSRRRLGHLHPYCPNPNARLPPRPLNNPNLNRPLQHPHWTPLRPPHARPAHEIHRRRRCFRDPSPYRISDRRRRHLHRHHPPIPRSHGHHVPHLPLPPSPSRPRRPALSGAQLRLLRDQVHPIQSGFPLFQIHHSQILARPRRNTARPLRHPLPRPHHWLRLRHEYLQRGDLPISPSAASG